MACSADVALTIFLDHVIDYVLEQPCSYGLEVVILIAPTANVEDDGQPGVLQYKHGRAASKRVDVTMRFRLFENRL